MTNKLIKNLEYINIFIMDNSTNIPIYEINRENIESEWTNLLESIKTSSFLSIDIVSFDIKLTQIK